MSDFVTKDDDLKATIQSLLECRRMMRSTVATTESLEILANETTATVLRMIREHASQADKMLLDIYKRNAREAFDGQLA